MFEVPLDAWYVWAGLGLVSVAVGGIALGLPTAAPPTAGPAADAIDNVATSPNRAQTTVELSAEKLRLSRHAIALDTAGGTARARFVFGPVTPVSDGRLRRLLRGDRPADVFRSKRGFRSALETARSRHHRWQSAPETLTARRVRWGDVNATVVG